MFFLNILSLLVFAIATTSAATIPKQRNTSGFISPTAGTIVAPGGQFDFKWDTMADYGLSSYNFTVFLFTQAPTSMAPSEFFGSGYYLGRFSEPNYPGNPYPKNPAPPQLTMPNLSISPGGFGSGSAASNKKVYLAVLEEYSDGTKNFGLKLNFGLQELIYNGTTQSV